MGTALLNDEPTPDPHLLRFRHDGLRSRRPTAGHAQDHRAAVCRRYQEQRGEIKELQAEFTREREEILESIRDLNKELKLKQFVIERCIPPQQLQARALPSSATVPRRGDAVATRRTVAALTHCVAAEVTTLAVPCGLSLSLSLSRGR